MQQSFLSFVVILVTLQLALTSNFDINVTSTCTQYVIGQPCYAWVQSGTINEQTAACFPGETTVATLSGSKSIHALSIGDRVLCYNPVSKADQECSVIAWLHHSISKKSKYLKLQSNSLQLIVSHYHNVADNKPNYTFRFAKDMLGAEFVADLQQTITNIQQVELEGVYAPLTNLNNFYVVSNGKKILVHSYANIKNPEKYQTIFSGIVSTVEYLNLGGFENGLLEYMHPVASTLSTIFGQLTHGM